MTTDAKALAKAQHILTLRDENVPGCCVSDAAPVAEAYLASEAARKEADGVLTMLLLCGEREVRAAEDAGGTPAQCLRALIDGLIEQRQRAEKAEAEVARLRTAAENLRAAQRAYMADRGNERLGKAVGIAAIALDEALASLGVME